MEPGSFIFKAIQNHKTEEVKYEIWKCFYFVIQHQIVLKLLECHHGVVDCQSELKLVCGSRDFPFESHPISQTEEVEYEIWSALICNSTSDCLETT